MKKVLLWFCLIFLTLLLLLFGGLAYVWTHPKEAWALIESRFLPADLKISWESLEFDIRRSQGMAFSFEGVLIGLQVKKENPRMDLPVELIRWNIELRPFQNTDSIRVHDITIKAPQTLRFTAGPPQNKPEGQDPFEQLQGYLSLLQKFWNLNVGTFDVGLKEFIFTSYEGKATHLSANLSRSQQLKEDLIRFIATVILPDSFRLDLDGELNLDSFKTSKPFLRAQLKIQGQGINSQQVILFQSEGQDTLIQTRGPIRYSKNKIRITALPEMFVRLSSKGADLQLHMKAHGLPGPIVKIDNLNANLNIPFTKGRLWSDKPAAFSLNLPLNLFFIDKNMRPPFEKACACKIPESLRLDWQGQVWLRDLFSQPSQQKKILESRVTLQSYHNKLFSIHLAALLNLHKKSNDYILDPFVDSRMTLHSFRGLRNILDAKNILIPAPLSVLDGTIDFTAYGPIDRMQEVYRFPLKAQLQLASQNQKVHIDANSLVHLGKKMDFADFKIQMALYDLQLELPPLNPLGGRPRVIPDSRLLKQPPKVPAKKTRKFRIGFDFELQTLKPGAIRLLTKYADPYIPLSVLIRADEKKSTQGYIQTELFNVEYLRRTVIVEKMRIDLDDLKKDILPLEGRLRLDQAEYRIYINFNGTLKEPHITLTSDPYLPQNEIIAVLLYGRTSDQLISADAQTAGSFGAAMADRAIGILGLWAFAATPIQSFSYNPVTKVYAATVMISEDLTAGVGTNWEEATRFQLQTRVSRRWLLTASWTPNEEGDVEEKLVLQWEKRF